MSNECSRVASRREGKAGSSRVCLLRSMTASMSNRARAFSRIRLEALPHSSPGPRLRRRSEPNEAAVLLRGHAPALLAPAARPVGIFLYWFWFGRPFSWVQAQGQRRDRAERPEGDNSTVFSDVHPYVGYVEEPTSESGVRRSDNGQKVPVSEFGYIDDKSPIQTRGPDKVVVAVLGGSVACYFAVNGTRRLEADLARSPEFAGKRFVFVNLAIGGYKEPQQLMTLAYLMTLGAQFDLVLNIDGFNEVALYELENASHHIFPAFPRSWHAKVGSTDPVLGLTRGRLLVIEDARTSLARWHSRAPWRYSVLCNVLWQSAIGVSNGRHSASATSTSGPTRATAPMSSPARSRIRQSRRALRAPRRDLDEQLASPEPALQRKGHAVLPLPPAQPVFPRLQADGRGGEEGGDLARASLPPGVEIGYPLLLRNGRKLKEQGVRFFDLTGIFKDHPEPIYVDSCCHSNQRRPRPHGRRHRPRHPFGSRNAQWNALRKGASVRPSQKNVALGRHRKLVSSL